MAKKLDVAGGIPAFRTPAMTAHPSNTPRIALTLGEAAGIGPEVTAKAVAAPSIAACCRPVVIGEHRLFEQARQAAGLSYVTEPIDDLAGAERVWAAGNIPVWNPRAPLAEVQPGRYSSATGQAAYDWLIAAIDAAQVDAVDGLCTAPLSKAALHAAGLRYPGHTEILAERCQVPQHAMMLYLPPGPQVQGSSGLGIAHVTLHTSLASVPSLITTAKVQAAVTLVDRFLEQLDAPRRRIGVCALNPHAGEEGLFGNEESRLIAPAVAQSVATGYDAAGPFPTDTLIRRAVLGEFDGLVAMYHDQGHIALKLIGFGTAVNVTLGLPIVRTSPSHGTAFDIAGTHQADPTGMIQAILVAAQLAATRLRKQRKLP